MGGFVHRISILASIFALACYWCNFIAHGRTDYPPSDALSPTGRFLFYSSSGDQDLTSGRHKRASMFHTAKCSHQNQDGFCYGEVTCKHLKGRSTEFCDGLLGVCCIFYRHCGSKTALDVTYFRNDDWPIDEVMKPTCTFSVAKREDICAMSLTIKKLDFPGKVGACSHTFVWITGIPERRLNLICGTFRGATYIFNVTSSTEVFIKVRSHPELKTFRSSWNMIVRQVPCSEFLYEVLPERNDGLFLSLAPIAETPRPDVVTPSTSTTATTTTTTTTRAPPAATAPNLSQCGVKGIKKQRDESDTKDNFESQSKIGNTNGTDGTGEPLPGVSITEWDAPEAKDSQFYKLQGEKAVFDQRITYGEVAEIGEFPWQAALYVGRSFHCGGSIISDQHILTAGHCVSTYDENPQSLRILLGAWDVRSPKKENSESYTIRQVHVHQNYSRSTLRNDIAILKLDRKINFKNTIRPVCLPFDDKSAAGKLAIVTGWGRDQTKRLVSKLHKLHAAILSNDVCDERWRKVGAKKGFIVLSMMCMDSQNGDSCNGDSGGPTVVENPKVPGQFFQVGVVSFGSGSCTDKRLPGVYTRVSSYIDWIKSHMN